MFVEKYVSDVEKFHTFLLPVLQEKRKYKKYDLEKLAYSLLLVSVLISSRFAYFFEEKGVAWRRFVETNWYYF